MNTRPPATPVAVVQHLSELTRDLRQQVEMLATADREAAEKRHAANMVETRAFLRAEGSMELRKHKARLAADDAELQALVAESLVRVLRAKIRTIETSIEVGRSYGATVRAEFKTLGMTDETG